MLNFSDEPPRGNNNPQEKPGEGHLNSTHPMVNLPTSPRSRPARQFARVGTLTSLDRHYPIRRSMVDLLTTGAFSKMLSLSRPAYMPPDGDVSSDDGPAPADLPDSRLKSLLVQLSQHRGKSLTATKRRRALLDEMGELVFSRMSMHRSLFWPQWSARVLRDYHYDSHFRPLDLERDVLFTCRVEGAELLAVVERKQARPSGVVLTRTVRFPVCYLVDDGENRMWREAADLLKRLRAEHDSHTERFDEAEADVQALLAQLSPVVR